MQKPKAALLLHHVAFSWRSSMYYQRSFLLEIGRWFLIRATALSLSAYRWAGVDM
jgi:hypothetical protein